MGFDTGSYTGLWHEYGRYPSIYENDCEGAQAEYFFDKEHQILRIKNSCIVDGVIIRSDWGTARPSGTDGIFLLKFDRFGANAPETPYQVLFTDYENFAFVGSHEYNYFWILSRRPQLYDDEVEYLNKKTRELGFDPRKLIRNPTIRKLGLRSDPLSEGH